MCLCVRESESELTFNQDIRKLCSLPASFQVDVCVDTLDKTKSADSAHYACVVKYACGGGAQFLRS